MGCFEKFLSKNEVRNTEAVHQTLNIVQKKDRKTIIKILAKFGVWGI